MAAEYSSALPSDWRNGSFVGRIQTAEGPSPVLVVGGQMYDMSRVASTVSELVERGDFSGRGGTCVEGFAGGVGDLLAPIDLQCVKAAGVTFAVSAIERVIEEKARGDRAAASAIRDGLEVRMGGSIRAVRPGSDEAMMLKNALIDDGLWSQYLEVAIGPDAELFTKAPVLSSIGPDSDIGVRSDSTWNNPEPEVVLLVDSRGSAVGAALGNDVNLRDFEGRSALLLGKAKDNNASCALGPLVRLFDQRFTMEDVRQAEVGLTVLGIDGYHVEGVSSMAEISRDPLELVRQAMSQHQYPDGFVIFCGTLFAPVEDRDEAGRGFTHKIGDIVAIQSERLGRLVNRVTTCQDAAPWTFGIGALMSNLARRNLL